jgi:hypothetical protein
MECFGGYAKKSRQCRACADRPECKEDARRSEFEFCGVERSPKKTGFHRVFVPRNLGSRESSRVVDEKVA